MSSEEKREQGAAPDDEPRANDAAHRVVDGELRLLAERHVRGETSGDERARYAAHLERCDVCRGLVEEDATLRSAVLDLLAGPAPAPRVWARVERAIGDDRGDDSADGTAVGTPRSARPVRDGDAGDGEARQPWKSWVSSRTDGANVDDALVPAREREWIETAHRGVRVQRLSADRAERRVTMLVRMEPGASFPPHRHGGAEECFVVEGELFVGAGDAFGSGVVLRGGDFQRCASGSTHPRQWTETGCTLLITSSIDDELLG